MYMKLVSVHVPNRSSLRSRKSCNIERQTRTPPFKHRMFGHVKTDVKTWTMRRTDIALKPHEGVMSSVIGWYNFPQFSIQTRTNSFQGNPPGNMPTAFTSPRAS